MAVAAHPAEVVGTYTLWLERLAAATRPLERVSENLRRDRGSALCTAAARVKIFSVHVDHSGLDLLVYLGVATVLGVVIGLERQWRSRMAGLQTMALVSMGSALFTILGADNLPSQATAPGWPPRLSRA